MSGRMRLAGRTAVVTGAAGEALSVLARVACVSYRKVAGRVRG